jgi:Helix-turn-helix domain
MSGVGAPIGRRGRHESWEVPVQIEGSTMPAGQGTLPRPASRLGYTPAEVATIVGKHQNTIYLWLKAGVLKSRRINRDHYIPVAEVVALLDEGAVA